MKFEKMSMKVLSVFMSLIMLFSVCAPVISATEINAPMSDAEKEKLVYVSIGDSMTNGYGLDGYNGNSGIMNYAKNTYSNKFAAWLAGYTGKIENDQVIFDGPFATVDHRQLAMSGMRAEDLHWLLKLNYENSEFMETIYNQWYSSDNSWEKVVKDLWFGEWGFKVGDFRTWTDLCDGDYRYADGAARILATYGKDENEGFFQSSFAGEKEIQNAIKGVGKKQYYPTNKNECEQIGGYRYLQIATEFYQKSVEDADIISLALGNTNFGTFMFAAIVEILSGPESELEIFRNRYDVEDVFALAELDPALEQKIRDFIPQIEDYVHEKFGSLTGGEKDRMDALTNIILYCFSSYLVNYIGVVNEILAVNPDVQIIQVALMNAYADEVEGITETTLGDVVDFMYGPLNAFIAGLPTAMKATGDPLYADAHFYYAETDSVECMVHVFGDDYYYKDETKEEFTGYLGFDVSETEGVVANVDSVARDRFFAYIKGSLLAPLGGKLGLSNLDGLTLGAIFEYEQMSNTEKAAFAVKDKDTAMACAFYLAFENALIKAGRGIVTLNSLVMSAEIYDTKNFSVLSPVLVQFKEQIVNTAPAYAKDVAEAMAPVVAKTVADTINGMLAGFGVKIELTVTQQDVLKIMTDGEAGTQTKAVCEAIAEQARVAVIEAVAPVYKAGVIEQVYASISGVFKTYGIPASVYGIDGFDHLNEAQKEAFLLAFAADYANGFPTLKAISSQVAAGLLMNNDMKSAVLAIASINDANIKIATENYINGKLGNVTLKDNLLNQISAAMPKRVKDSASSLCTLLAVPETLSAVMTADEESPICSLLCMAARVLIGDGIGGHPSEGGHTNLYDVIHDSYVNGHTSFDETVDNLIIVRDFIYDHRDEVWAWAYAQAKNAGLIDEMDSYLVLALEAIAYAESWANEYKEYFRSEDFALQITVTADNAKATVESLRDLLKNANQLNTELYDKALMLLAGLETNLADLAALVNIAVKDADAYVTPIVKAELARALAFLNAKINAIQEAIAFVKTTVNEQIVKAEALIREFAVTAEKYLAEFVGKKEMAEAYLEAVLNKLLSKDAFSANYTVSEDSFYLNIGSEHLYAELLAEKLGFGADQFGTMAWDSLDSSVIVRADLITIGYNEALISGFAADQILGYVKNYISTHLKDGVDAYVDAALRQVFDNMTPALKESFVEELLGQAGDAVNGAFDNLLGNEIFADAALENMDWAEIVGEENAHYVEQALKAVRAALIEMGLPETYTFEQDVTALFLENLDQMSPDLISIVELWGTESILGMLGEYKTFKHEIPVADAVMFALESYLYSYVKFNVEYARLVYAVRALNPDAQIVLLGNYNAFEDILPNLEIRDIIIRFGDFLPSDLKDTANGAINGVFGVLENAVSAETVDAVFQALEMRIAQAYDEIKSVCGEVSDFDLIEAVKEIAFDDIDLEALVGAENLDHAKKLIKVIQYILVESDTYDAIVEKAPAKEEIFGLIEAFEEKIKFDLAQLDAPIKGAFEQIGMTLTEAREILDALSGYIADAKAQTLTVQSYLNTLYDMIAAYGITIEGTTIDLGEMIGAPSSVHSLVYAYAMENVIFVDISEAETVWGEGSAVDFLLDYILDHSVANVSAEGHAYIAEQIDHALRIVCLHRDADKDHACDYCHEIRSVCEDTDKDHKCDVCGEELSACADTDKNHECDLCGKALSECADTDKNHECDLCGKELSECADTDKDHKCDLCGKALSECADTDKDHKCDVCGKALSECADTDKDHKCDLCGKELSECADTDKDHKCDLCGKALSECADTDKDHKCDLCGKALSECADTDKDHKCDLCGKALSECVDEGKDHKCDVCGEIMTQCADGNNDHYCDVCGTNKLSECVDSDEDGKCDICGADVVGEIGKDGLSTGAIVAIVAGSVVAAGGIGFAVWFFVFKKKIFAKK